MGGIAGAERASRTVCSQPARKIGLGQRPRHDVDHAPPPAPAKQSKAAEASRRHAEGCRGEPADTRQAANRPPFKPAASEAEPAPLPGWPGGRRPADRADDSFDSRFSATK